jgi:hypothetical protein
MEAIMNLKKELSLAETNKELLITELDQKTGSDQTGKQPIGRNDKPAGCPQ